MTAPRILFGAAGPGVIAAGEPIRAPDPADAEQFAQLRRNLPAVAALEVAHMGELVTVADALVDVAQREELAGAILALALL